MYRFKTTIFRIGWFDDQSYFVHYSRNCDYEFDEFVSQLLGLTMEEYQGKLVTLFNGRARGSVVFFKSKADAEKALEWIENNYLMRKLRGEVD
jgi:hypothetical protein